MSIFVDPCPPAAIESRGTIHLPLIMAGEPPALDAVAALLANPLAYAFYQLLRTDPRQERPTLIACPSLIAAARQRAHGLANGDPWSHVDAQGRWPNWYARQAGCRLPAHYGDLNNNIESLVGGSPDAWVLFNALANSPGHAAHIFGRNEFFRQQRHFGIGMAVGGRYGWYLCVMIGICEGEATSGE